MKELRRFSEELVEKVLRGISCRRYNETVLEAAQAFGVSASAVSAHIIEATAKKLQGVKGRSLSSFDPCAVFLDTVHRGGEAFIVGLGIEVKGRKMACGFWQGATENDEICEELIADMERRGLKISRRMIWGTGGGSGIIKALKERFGKKLIHQRCTLHKDRNIQKHLAKKYRKGAHRRFRTAMERNSDEDARQMLLEMEKWLRGINESAADSLREAFEEILTLHRLKIPGLLRKTLHYRRGGMTQRWLAAVLLYAERICPPFFIPV